MSAEPLDNTALVPNTTFPDFDLDNTDIGGTLSWGPPDDISQVTHYFVYFAVGRWVAPKPDVTRVILH